MKGKQPENLRTAWIDCAHRMGYFCAENTETALPFDGLMYRREVVVAVKLKKVRYSPGENFSLGKKFPDDVEALLTLPLPPTVSRELWLRTQNERAFRRFWVIPGTTTVEIEEVARDGYRNPHYQKGYWENAPYKATLYFADRGKVLKEGGERDPQKTP
jgi:hypothetical protein